MTDTTAWLAANAAPVQTLNLPAAGDDAYALGVTLAGAITHASLGITTLVKDPSGRVIARITAA